MKIVIFRVISINVVISAVKIMYILFCMFIVKYNGTSFNECLCKLSKLSSFYFTRWLCSIGNINSNSMLRFAEANHPMQSFLLY